MNSNDLKKLVERVKRESTSDDVDLLLLTKSVEDCFITQDLFLELLNYDIYCINWSEFKQHPKYTMDNFNKVNSLSFICLEPIIDVLKEIIFTLEVIKETGTDLKINIFVPYSSEIHIEYVKNIGLSKETFGNKLNQLNKFDFNHIRILISTITKLDVSIEAVNWISIFYCDSSLITKNMSNSVFCTCFEYNKTLNPILEVYIEDIYNQVVLERKNCNLEKYTMPALFNVENTKKNMNLLNIDNLPIQLRILHSRHLMQLMTFIRQLTGKELWSKEININLLSVGSTSRTIAKSFNNSYNEIIRFRKENKSDEICLKHEITLLIMDRNLDLISPIYSPILNMNVNENNLFSDQDIIEFLDEYISNNQKLTLECENNLFDETDIKNIHEITNPTLLSIMLDPEKLQKDLIISENYPVLSYKFISALEDLQSLIKSGEKEFSDSKKNCIISRLNSAMRNYKITGVNSWMFLLLGIKQSQYVKSFWDELSDIKYNEANHIDRKKFSFKRIITLKVILKYLRIINNGIFPNKNMNSPSTLTSTSSLSSNEDLVLEDEEDKIIGYIVSILTSIRTKLLPDSITNFLIQFETFNSTISSCDLSLELSTLLSIIHLFLVPIFPLESHSFNSIFVKQLRKKFTSSSFENLSIENFSTSSSFFNKIIALAISCSSYEGPDCRLTSFNLELPREFSQLNIKNKLNNIRSTRNCLNFKSFRNFQLCSFLSKKKYSQEFFSLVSQISLYLFQVLYLEDCPIFDIPSKEWLNSDLNILKLPYYREEGKETKNRILIINIIGNISLNEIFELERLLERFKGYLYKKFNFKLVIVTDHICSSTSLTKSILNDNSYFS